MEQTIILSSHGQTLTLDELFVAAMSFRDRDRWDSLFSCYINKAQPLPINANKVIDDK